MENNLENDSEKKIPGKGDNVLLIFLVVVASIVYITFEFLDYIYSDGVSLFVDLLIMAIVAFKFEIEFQSGVVKKIFTCLCICWIVVLTAIGIFDIISKELIPFWMKNYLVRFIVLVFVGVVVRYLTDKVGELYKKRFN